MIMEIHEDYIGQIEIIAEENYFSSLNDNKSIDLDSNGSFENINERKGPKIKLESLGIKVDDISDLLLPLAKSSITDVFSVYSNSKTKLINTRAFVFERISIYVEANENGIVKRIYLYPSVMACKETHNAKLPNALNKIGITYNVVLVDWDEEIIVRLKSKNQVGNYLSSVFGFTDN